MLNLRKIRQSILQQYEKGLPLGKAETAAGRFVTANKFALVRMEQGPFAESIYKADMARMYGPVLVKPLDASDGAELTDTARVIGGTKYRSVRRRTDGTERYFREELLKFFCTRPPVDFYLVPYERGHVILAANHYTPTVPDALFAVMTGVRQS